MKGWRQEGTWGVDGPGRWKVARAHSINCRVNQWEVAPVCGVWTEGSCAGGRGEGAFDRNWPQSWNSMPSSSKGPVDVENHKSVGWFSPPFSTASTLINLCEWWTLAIWGWDAGVTIPVRRWGVSWTVEILVLKLESSGIPRDGRAGREEAKGQENWGASQKRVCSPCF